MKSTATRNGFGLSFYLFFGGILWKCYRRKRFRNIDSLIMFGSFLFGTILYFPSFFSLFSLLDEDQDIAEYGTLFLIWTIHTCLSIVKGENTSEHVIDSFIAIGVLFLALKSYMHLSVYHSFMLWAIGSVCFYIMHNFLSDGLIAINIFILDLFVGLPTIMYVGEDSGLRVFCTGIYFISLSLFLLFYFGTNEDKYGFDKRNINFTEQKSKAKEQ